MTTDDRVDQILTRLRAICLALPDARGTRSQDGCSILTTAPGAAGRRPAATTTRLPASM
jgi:hypothetical protein